MDMANSQDLRSKRPFLVFSSLVILSGLLFGAWLNSGAAANFRTALKERFLDELVYVSPLPPGRVADAAYVLGGGQASLKLKYQVAADLLKKGAIGEIWILGRTGITEFIPEYGRNLTNDEWSTRQLQKYGVPADKVEIFQLEEGFFGTLSEARQVSALARQRGLRTLALIAQPYHSRRVDLSFRKFMDSGKTKYFVQSTEETHRLYEAAIEFFKLKVYAHLLVN
jgi:uncharacterized SAM-binding protein YcdF (DUF218 family)